MQKAARLWLQIMASTVLVGIITVNMKFILEQTTRVNQETENMNLSQNPVYMIWKKIEFGLWFPEIWEWSVMAYK